ncbi:MAG TPA: L-threonylcarbamoyladenylate synthase [Tenuifilaceae bacterium]|nr:L-threonylcarbamoyladenylate synthase [Tenuifilaceae bacterium]HOZ14872.1 L-threonylcarbamoyladenylate synthase [Tenuifilaceae bacterium]HPN22972.1 L-threonylcarbamoyladenylate synthase [Tenuifilaceae bacterium]HPV55785.1 L-threonylcarbamoyladenylate synthase [Tenuifilaceae bacterium]
MIVNQDIDIAAGYIREGRLVAFPTETVYGLGANALNPLAVAKIFELKERPSFDPLIVHIASVDDLDKLTVNKDSRVLLLAEKFWPGPLTIVLPKSDIVPDIVTSGLDTVGIRMPNNPIALELIRKAGCPIAAPSANKFGRVSPTTAQHVKKQLPNVDYILDGGKTQVGIESTIITLNENGFEILRHGVITREDLESFVPFHSGRDTSDSIVAPGMLKSHYSPNKPLYFLGDVHLNDMQRSNAGLLSFNTTDTEGYKIVIPLSNSGNLREYAVNLFAAIHKMEESDVEYIVAEPVEEHGIGLAIMDRLRKAAFRYRG